ncbi:hypothetical protein [Ruegeria sp. HKCCA6837]|uniref:hypothetical protein n=1 Tax=Ruegeria sp. HKCCA6837 TaxID=2682989 RepID=UPI001489F394|nr:hypothetical protein [Ruegeria sp. HKCCA6837]
MKQIDVDVIEPLAAYPQVESRPTIEKYGYQRNARTMRTTISVLVATLFPTVGNAADDYTVCNAVGDAIGVFYLGADRASYQIGKDINERLIKRDYQCENNSIVGYACYEDETSMGPQYFSILSRISDTQIAVAYGNNKKRIGYIEVYDVSCD